MNELTDLLLDAIEDDDHTPLTSEAVDFALTICNLDEVLYDSEIPNLHNRDHNGGDVSSSPSLVVDHYQLAS